MSESKLERSLHAQQAALTRWALEPNRTAATQAWRDGHLRKLEQQVDPEGVLPPEERAQRAEKLRLAHLAKARNAAARNRRERAAAKNNP